MDSIIVSAFPGIGKSKLYEENKVNFSDSDSSKFDKKNFPKNYIEHIKKIRNENKQVLWESN